MPYALRAAIVLGLCALALFVVILLTVLGIRRANAHDWYPVECCSSIDCAPVESWSYVAAAIFEHGSKTMPLPRLVVTTRRGTFVLPDTLPRRASKDNRMHVCSRPDGSIICIFEPPGT